MLRFSSGAYRNSSTDEGAVMKLMLRMAGLLSFGGVLQRLLWALRELCCLNAVFVYFTGVQRLFHLRKSGCCITSGSLHALSQPFYIANRSSFPSRRTPTLSV